MGRIRHARENNFQVLISPKKYIGKKRTVVKSRKPQGMRRNVSAMGTNKFEVFEEPVMKLLSFDAVAKVEIGGKSSPLMIAFEIEDKLSTSLRMTKCQT